MLSLADLLNAPADFTFEEKSYKLRQPTLMECGRYQRWLESEARASALAATELPEDERRALLRDVNRDIAAQIYAWGSEVCVRSLGTPNGIAKLMSIVCEEQGVTYALAQKMVEKRLEDIALLLRAAEESDDGELKKNSASLLKSVGLSPNFLRTSSADSPTTPADPPTSSPLPT